MKIQSVFRRTALACVCLAALTTSSCSPSPDSRITDVNEAQTTTTKLARTVRTGPLGKSGDSAAPATTVSFPPCEIAGSDAVYPGERWQTAYADARGWSEEGLDRAWQRAREGHYAAGMLVQGGEVVSWFGDVDTPYEAASIRKSLLNAIVGQLVAEGRLSLDATLAELGINENPPLNDGEKSATLRDLLMSRSGIYRDAAYTLPSQEEERPEPGTYGRGEHFYYNNWDFNALGTIVERATGKSVFELFRDRVAAPIGMQDYSLDDTRYERDSRSIHPAYLFRLSTRDRARFGYLYLRNGCWAGKQVVPADWVKKSTAALTDRTDELDYGYLWWSQEGIESLGLDDRIFMARGNPLQYIMVFPELDAVLVLTADRNYPGWVNWIRSRLGFAPEFEDYSEMLTLLLEARRPSARPIDSKS